MSVLPGKLSHFSQWLLQGIYTFLKNADTPSASQSPWAGLSPTSKRKQMRYEGNVFNFLAPDLQICLRSRPFLLPAEEVSFHKYKINPSLQPCQWSFPCLCPKLCHSPSHTAPPLNGPFVSEPGLKLSWPPSSPVTKSSVFHILNLYRLYLVIYLLCHHHP